MRISIVLLILLCSLLVMAQAEFEEWLKQQDEEFFNWKNQQDKEFSEFLEKGWSYYETSEPVVRDTVPKPENIPNPVDQGCPDLIAGEIVEVKRSAPKVKQPDPLEILEELRRDQLMYAVSKGTETLRLTYWGLVFKLNYNLNMKIEKPAEFNSRAIADYWGRISNTDYEIFHKDLKKMKEKFMLNDWAYSQLIYNSGAAIYEDVNMANLLTWFILTKSGYDCKVGYNNDEIYLLLPTQTRIYGEPRLVLEDKDYYALDLSDSGIKPVSIYTYDGSYPDANDLIDLNLATSPYLNEVIIERELTFSYKDSTWTIPVRQNRTLVEFLAEYPATDLQVYFGSEISAMLRESLVNGLKPIIDNKTQAEALNILLHFVQKAFKYKTDREQFGEENSLFPEETFYYEYCDCEDRSFLYSYLVEEFLGLRVIGLDYPGHIATAVQMNFDIAGDKITFDGSDYLVCDPTYINADIGVVMPQYLNVEPEIIQFR